MQQQLALLSWLWKQEKSLPICPHCYSIYTFKYFLAAHGYGCAECGKDFGRVIKLR